MPYEYDKLDEVEASELPTFVGDGDMFRLAHDVTKLSHSLNESWKHHSFPVPDMECPELPRILVSSECSGAAFCRLLKNGRHEVVANLGVYYRVRILAELIIQSMSGSRANSSCLDLSPLFDLELTTCSDLDIIWENLGSDGSNDLSTRTAAYAFCLSLLHEVGHAVFSHKAIKRKGVTNEMKSYANQHRRKELAQLLQIHGDMQASQLGDHTSGKAEDEVTRKHSYSVDWLKSKLDNMGDCPAGWGEASMRRSFELMADSWANGALFQSSINEIQSPSERTNAYFFAAIANIYLHCIYAGNTVEDTDNGYFYPDPMQRITQSLTNGLLQLYRFKQNIVVEVEPARDRLVTFHRVLLDQFGICDGVPTNAISALVKISSITADDTMNEVDAYLQSKDELAYAVGLTNAYGMS